VADHAVIGYVHGGTVRAEFCASLISIAMEGTTPLDAVLTLESGPNISTARNKLVREFLDSYDAPWLFMCDTDMVLAAGTIDRLIEAADPVARPVVGGLCFSLDGGEKLSTMYELTEKDGRPAFTRYGQWPDDTCMRVSATGAACLLMHRDALVAVEKHATDVAAPWFRETSVGPLALMGEDLTFCLRCAAAGIPVHVCTGVKVGHMKTTMLI
jgi:GT2 family glycosyltransferase